jgi:hypothetical protein
MMSYHTRWRVLSLVWLSIYIPAYTQAFGPWHFLQLCNVGVLVLAAGVITGSRRLICSQMLALPLVSLMWVIDAASKLLTGHFIHAGTAYMWDDALPVVGRFLSLYHVIFPLMLLRFVIKHGYEPRAYTTQCVVAGA